MLPRRAEAVVLDMLCVRARRASEIAVVMAATKVGGQSGGEERAWVCKHCG